MQDLRQTFSSFFYKSIKKPIELIIELPIELPQALACGQKKMYFSALTKTYSGKIIKKKIWLKLVLFLLILSAKAGGNIEKCNKF